jgi:hypothetical protein
MDPINLIQFSLYSKMMSESINILDSGYISKNTLLVIIILMVTYKMIPIHVYDYIERKIETLLQEKRSQKYTKIEFFQEFIITVISSLKRLMLFGGFTVFVFIFCILPCIYLFLVVFFSSPYKSKKTRY